MRKLSLAVETAFALVVVVVLPATVSSPDLYVALIVPCMLGAAGCAYLDERWRRKR